MTGSTLYRRLPDGSWASEREDFGARPQPGASVSSTPEQVDPASPAQPLSAADAPAAAEQTPASAPRPRVVRARPRRVWLKVLAAMVGAYLVWIVCLLFYTNHKLNQVDAMPADQIADTSGQVWLLVGSDSREGLTKAEQSELHTGGDVGQRTDTIMLVHQQRGQDPTLISIPRDSWVTIPAHTSSDGTQVAARDAKINAAYSYGAASLLIQTIEYNTGLHVDHYMEIGFSGIVQMTDAVNGITVCFDEAIDDEKSDLHVKAGCQRLTGKEALAWVRMRYADPKGDLGRIERQQEYVAKMVHRLATWQMVVNPFRQVAVVDAATGAFTVDQHTGIFDLSRFGLGMSSIARGSGTVTTVPTDDSNHWANGQWVLRWDTKKADKLFASLGGSEPQSAG